MAPLFREISKIMYTDTNSLIYHVEYDYVYDMKRDRNRFDTNNYTVDIGISLANKTGLMKDENNDVIMIEFIGLRAKMYTLRRKKEEYERHQHREQHSEIYNVRLQTVLELRNRNDT